MLILMIYVSFKKLLMKITVGKDQIKKSNFRKIYKSNSCIRICNQALKMKIIQSKKIVFQKTYLRTIKSKNLKAKQIFRIKKKEDKIRAAYQREIGTKEEIHRAQLQQAVRMNLPKVMNSLNLSINSLIPSMRMNLKIVSFYFTLNIFFQDFSNPLKRKEFDRKRLHQQMREIQSVSYNSL